MKQINILLIIIFATTNALMSQEKIKNSMETIIEFEKLVNWIEKNSESKINKLNNSSPRKNLEEIKSIIGEKLPNEFIELYSKYDGEENQGLKCIFFGHKFLSSSEIIQYFEFPKSLIKPKKRFIKNPKKSDEIINKIKSIIMGYINKSELKNKNWSKVEISFGNKSFNGLKIYLQNGQSEYIQNISNDFSNKLFEVSGLLYSEEKDTYNWDDIILIFHKSGKINTFRKDYDWDNETPFESIPKEKIKRKYFNIKWIPIFSDHGGNYIGLDLDPDKKGIKGQVIIFGRDEDKAYVLAENLQGLFRKINVVTDSYKNSELKFPLLGEYHIHSELPKLLKIE